MFLRLRRGLPVLLPHEGLVTTSYGHVDDLCTNLLEMAQLPAAAGEIVNITGQGVSSRAFTETLAEIVGVEADIVAVPTGFSDAKLLYGHLFGVKHHGILSVAKAAALGLTVERGFRTGYEETYDWFAALAARGRAGPALGSDVGGRLRLRARGAGGSRAQGALMEDRVPPTQ